MDIKELTKTKDHGNDLFKEKKYQEAVDTFNTCITSIEGQESKDYLSKEK